VIDDFVYSHIMTTYCYGPCDISICEVRWTLTAIKHWRL